MYELIETNEVKDLNTTILEFFNPHEKTYNYYVKYEEDENLYYSFGVSFQDRFTTGKLKLLIRNGYFDGLSTPSVIDLDSSSYETIVNYLLNNYDEGREETPTKESILSALTNNPYDIIYGLVCELEELNKVIDEL